MNTFTKALRAVKALTRMQWGVGGGAGWSASAWQTRLDVDHAAKVGDGLSNSIVAACIGWVQRTLPEAPLALRSQQPGGDSQQLYLHPMLDLLNQPNQFYGLKLLLMATCLSLMTDGNAYWLKVRSAAGRVVELWWVPQALIEPVWPRDGSAFLSGYEYRPNGSRTQPIQLAVSDVVHFRDSVDPRNPRKGLAPLKSLIREIYTDDEAARFTAAMLRNGGAPGVIIAPADGEGVTVSDDDAKAIKDRFMQTFSGDHRGEPMVMSGPVQVTQFGLDVTKLDFAKLREIPEERITAVLGIPSAVVGFGSGLQQTAVGATMTELRRLAYEACIFPMQAHIADALRAQLLPDFVSDTEPFEVFFDLSRVRGLSEDKSALTERVFRGVTGGWMTVAEAQRQSGMPVDPAADYYLRQFSVTPVPAHRGAKARK